MNTRAAVARAAVAVPEPAPKGGGEPQHQAAYMGPLPAKNAGENAATPTVPLAENSIKTGEGEITKQEKKSPPATLAKRVRMRGAELAEKKAKEVLEKVQAEQKVAAMEAQYLLDKMDKADAYLGGSLIVAVGDNTRVASIREQFAGMRVRVVTAPTARDAMAEMASRVTGPTCVIVATPTISGAIDVISSLPAMPPSSMFILEVAGGVIELDKDEVAIRRLVRARNCDACVALIGGAHSKVLEWERSRRPFTALSEVPFGLQSARAPSLFANWALTRPLCLETRNLLETVDTMRREGLLAPGFAFEVKGELPKCTKSATRVSFAKGGGGIVTNMVSSSVMSGTNKPLACAHGMGTEPCGTCLAGLGGDALWTIIWRKETADGSVVVIESVLRLLARLQQTARGSTERFARATWDCCCGRATCMHMGDGPCPAPTWSADTVRQDPNLRLVDTTIFWISTDSLGEEEFALVESRLGTGFIALYHDNVARAALTQVAPNDLEWAIADAVRGGEAYSLVVAGADILKGIAICKGAMGAAHTAVLVAQHVQRANVIASGLGGAVNIVEMMGAEGSVRALADLAVLAHVRNGTSWTNSPHAGLSRSISVVHTSTSVEGAAKAVAEACKTAGLRIGRSDEAVKVLVATPASLPATLPTGHILIACTPVSDGKWVELYKVIGEAPLGAWIVTRAGVDWIVAGEYVAHVSLSENHVRFSNSVTSKEKVAVQPSSATPGNDIVPNSGLPRPAIPSTRRVEEFDEDNDRAPARILLIYEEHEGMRAAVSAIAVTEGCTARDICVWANATNLRVHRMLDNHLCIVDYPRWCRN